MLHTEKERQCLKIINQTPFPQAVQGEILRQIRTVWQYKAGRPSPKSALPLPGYHIVALEKKSRNTLWKLPISCRRKCTHCIKGLNNGQQFSGSAVLNKRIFQGDHAWMAEVSIFLGFFFFKKKLELLYIASSYNSQVFKTILILNKFNGVKLSTKHNGL